MIMGDTRKRSIAKIITWHIIAPTFTLAIIYFFTGQFIASTKATLTALAVGMLMFYVHERVWNKIKWGKK